MAVALIEAKPESKPPGHGLEQAKLYAASQRLNVQFVFASNGHQFVGFDRFTGLTHAPRMIANRMHTSRAALERLLDPANPSVTLSTLKRAAAVLGKELRVELT